MCRDESPRNVRQRIRFVAHKRQAIKPKKFADAIFRLVDRRFGKEKQKSESAVCGGILIPYTESEGNLFHSQKNGIENGRFELLPNANCAVQSGGRRQICEFRPRRYGVQLQFARAGIPFYPKIEESIYAPSNLSWKV